MYGSSEKICVFIFCFGEELADRKSGNEENVLLVSQIKNALFHLEASAYHKYSFSLRARLGYWHWRNCKPRTSARYACIY